MAEEKKEFFMRELLGSISGIDFIEISPRVRWGQVFNGRNNSVNNKNMKETNQKSFTIVYNEVVTREFTYTVLAESEDKAKEIIGGDSYGVENSCKVISRVVTQVK